METYAVVYSASVAVALGVTPVVARIARGLKIMDEPGLRKVHRTPVPRMGGVAIAFALMAGFGAGWVIDARLAQALHGTAGYVAALLAASLVVAAVGLVDDARGLRAGLRFVFQMGAAAGLCWLGIRIDSIEAAGVGAVPLGWLAWPLTLLWIVGTTNAVNLIDGLDGLAAGICAVAAGVLAVFCVWTGQPAMAALMLALLGALTGFLVFNLNPARIFMGDCGSTFMGFLLASGAVYAANTAGTSVGLAVVALALGVPIFDTLFSMLRRFVERRSMFAPDRNHLHHRLIKYGVRHRHAVLLIHGVTVVAGGLGMFMMLTTGLETVVVFVCVSALLVLMFRAVGSIRLNESVKKLMGNLALAREAKQQQKVFENAQLRIREAETFEGWWNAVCAAAEEMGVWRLSLKIMNRDGSSSCKVWERVGERKGAVVCTMVPIRQRQDQPALQAQVDVPVSSTLESAGLRMKFLSRLIDEDDVGILLATSAPPWVFAEAAPGGGAVSGAEGAAQQGAEGVAGTVQTSQGQPG